jgi:single-strand DNA-binding protein
MCRRNFSAGGTPTNEHHVLVCIGVVDVDVGEFETGVVDQAAPRGVREDAEEVVVLDAQRLFRLSQCDREVNAVRGTRRHNVAVVSFAGNLTDQPEVRYTEGGIARAMFRVAVSDRRDQEPSFFTVVVWRDQAEHVAESLAKGSRVVVLGRLQPRSWTAEDGSARSTVEVVAEELGPSLRWATATTTRATRSEIQ